MATTKTKAAEPAEETAEVAPRPAPSPIAPYRGDSWEALTANADQILGADLAKDRLLDALVSVPFLIHSVTFRPGVLRQIHGEPSLRAYVSCEAVIAPRSQLERRRVDTSTLPFDPEGQVVFNDGSTGIYRQVVQYLHMKGFIMLPEPITEGGPYGESSYDLRPDEWASIESGEAWFTADGTRDPFLCYQTNVRLMCPRGLRISEYESDYNPDGARTRYLG